MSSRILAVCLVCVITLPAEAAEWGSIKGRVVLRKKDDIPKLKPKIKKGAEVKDGEVCAAKDVPNLKLLINEKNRGIKNVFVYVVKVDAIHPNLKAVPKQPVVLDQKGCVFTPHAFFLRAGQSLKCTTQDNCAHNLRNTPFDNKQLNTTIPPKSKPITIGGDVWFKTPEEFPFTFECDFHKWMKCYAIILDHPYCAITNENGEFEIKDLPAGKHKLIVWHEAAGTIEKSFKVTVKAGAVTETDTVETKAKDFLGKRGVTDAELAKK